MLRKQSKHNRIGFVSRKMNLTSVVLSSWCIKTGAFSCQVQITSTWIFQPAFPTSIRVYLRRMMFEYRIQVNFCFVPPQNFRLRVPVFKSGLRWIIFRCPCDFCFRGFCDEMPVLETAEKVRNKWGDFRNWSLTVFHSSAKHVSLGKRISGEITKISKKVAVFVTKSVRLFWKELSTVVVRCIAWFLFRAFNWLDDRTLCGSHNKSL